MPNKKNKKTIRNIIIILLIIIALFVILCFVTPKESEVIKRTERIENLELPALRNNDEVIEHTGYRLVYDEENEVPLWVCYELTREEVSTLNTERKDNFRPDPKIRTGSAELSDYKGSGYDRGHMAPAADFRWSDDAMSDTFYLSNMCPQVHSFNAGLWGDLEAAVRSIAYEDESIYVVTGPVLTDGPYEKIGKNNVSVPKRFFKVILDYTEPEIKAIGFIMENKNSKEPLSYFAVSVDEVEDVTGLDFFPLLPDDEERLIESNADPSLWALRSFNPSEIKTSSEALEYTTTKNSNKEDNILSSISKAFVYLKKEVFKLLHIESFARKIGLL